MDSERLLERFLRYVAIGTTADEQADVYPSSPGQLELGKLLVGELVAMGLDDVAQDENGIVMATVAGTAKSNTPAIAWCAHLDTSPETPGADVRPQVIRDYPGGDIRLPDDPREVIRVADNPQLKQLISRTLITTDETTLLGADDKAGVAIIMEAAERLLTSGDAPHGPVRLCFTCDEEIGRGVDYVDLEELAAEVCYTLDGPGAGQIDVETFSADLAVVTVSGTNIHPSIAKGRMVNALRVAGELLSRLPSEEHSPESTEDREGFLHSYTIQGGVDQVRLRVLLRDFDTAMLRQHERLLRDAAQAAQEKYPGARIEIEVRAQDRNMAEGLDHDRRAVDYAERAFERIGLPSRRTIIRGGTDGSRLTEMGLPTPNLSSGQHNPHSPREWACLEEMAQAVDVLIALAQLPH